MSFFDWLADKFRARERRNNREAIRKQREEIQEKCPHKNVFIVKATDDSYCADCGKDMTE